MVLLLLGCQQTRPVPHPLPTAEPTVTTGVPQTKQPVQKLFAAAAVDPDPYLVRTLWDRLRQSFSLDHQLDRKAVQEELRWFRRNPDYFAHRAERLQRYLPTILAAVEQAGYPGELALVPMVESALDPYAFSPGGAAGFWQFIPATAARFRLRRNYWYEERRDVGRSTRAALSYLGHLHQRFGDWELALAAYNAGEGKVGRALRRLQRTGALPQQPFWHASLPKETRRYVPRILAMAAVIAAPDNYQARLPAITPDPALQRIKLPGQMDLTRVAQSTGLDLETLYTLNPALNQWATPPEGPHYLYVPADLAADTLEQRLAAVPMRDRVAWERITVQRGDTLSELAQRHKVDQADLRRSNQLQGDHLRAGQTLFVPRSAKALEQYPIARRISGKTHRVKPGDSLWSIANQYRVSIDQLVLWNELDPKAHLKVGRSLSVSPAKRSVVRTIRYRVRPGDSLYTIAKRFETTIAAIAAGNGLSTTALLKPGQPLTLKVNVRGAPISAGE